MLVWACLTCPAAAETKLRIATFNAELSRKGPGLLLRDILSETDPQVEAAAQVIAYARPDVLALQGIDYDHDLVALLAFANRIEDHGHAMPHIFSARPNSGMVTGLDLDEDGRTGTPRDAQGYGEFAGQGGMAVLSVYPIQTEDIRDFSGHLWRDIPGALLIREDGTPLLSEPVARDQRLSTVAHWDIPIVVSDNTFHLLTFHASPPVFDGPEDRNGRRNHDEIVFWQHYMNGAFGEFPDAPFAIAGDFNLDPVDGDGRKGAIQSLLSDPRLADTRPMRPDDVAQGEGQSGDPRLDTVDWPEPTPGSLRVSYILVSQQLTVVDSGMAVDKPATEDTLPSRHRLIWADVLLK